MRSLPLAVTSAINNLVKTNNVLSSVNPKAVIEWNMNNCFTSRGMNLHNAGDDPYSFGIDERLYFVDNKGGWQYPKTENGITLRESTIKSAESIAQAWREPVYQTIPIMTNNSTAPKLYNKPPVNLLPASSHGYNMWVSQPSGTTNNFFVCNGESLSFPDPVITTQQTQTTTEIIGAITEDSTTLRLLVKGPVPTNFVNKNINIDKKLTVSQWNEPTKSISVYGKYSIKAVGEGYIPDVIWGTTRGDANIIKFGSYRWNTIRAGDKIKPSTGTEPTNWWGSTTGYGTVEAVKKNSQNATPPSFWVDASFSPKVGAGILFKSQVGIIYTYLYWIDIQVASVPSIISSTTLNLKQISSVETTTATISNDVMSQDQLHQRIAELNTKGGTIVIGSNLTLTKPIILPSNIKIDATGRTISLSIDFNNKYNYVFYTYNPNVFVANAECAGNTNIVKIPSASAAAISPGQQIKIFYTKNIANPVGLSITINESKSVIARVVSKAAPVNNKVALTLDTTVVDSFANVPLYIDNNNQQFSGPIIITGGTWSLSGPANRPGFISANATNNLLIENVTITNGGNLEPLINLAGCTNVKIRGCSFSATGTGILLQSHNIRNRYDSCFNILIEKNTINCATGITSFINAGSEMSNHKNIKIGGDNVNVNSFTGSGVQINLQNCSHTAILRNTINGTAGGIAITSLNAKSSNNKIAFNNFSSSGKEIRLAGMTPASGISAVAIHNNTSIDQQPELINTSFITWANNSAVSTVTGTIPTGPFVVKAATPTTVYEDHSVEVMEYSKYGKRISLFLAEHAKNISPGEYVIVNGVHPEIDGARKVLAYTYNNNKHTLVLESASSGIINQTITDPDNDDGVVIVPKFLPINSVTVKFDTSYGTPASGLVQILTEEGWQTVFNFISSDLSFVQEKDSKVQSNIKSLRIFKSSSWTKSESDLNIENAINSGAVRVVIETVTANNQSVSVAELSGRLLHDITSDIKGFSLDKELGSSQDYMPVGISSSNTGSLELSNTGMKYSAINSSSPFHGLFVKNALCHIYLNYSTTSIKLGTMVVERWDSELRESASIDLIDKSIIFQNSEGNNIFLSQQNRSSGQVTIMSSIKAILNAKGFGNIKQFGSDHMLSAFYMRSTDNPWSTIQELLEPYQAAAYFDEYGSLQIMFRDYIFPSVFYTVGRVYQKSGQYKIELPSNYRHEITRGMLVSKANDSSMQATVESVNGNIITLSNAMTIARYDLRFSSGRAGNNYVVGRNSLINTHLDGAEIFSVGHTHFYNFDVDDRFNPKELVNSPTSIDNYARKFTKSYEFYTTDYSRTGSNASAKLNVSAAMIKLPQTGDSMFFSNMGTGMDTASTNIISYSGGIATYGMSGSSTIPLNNDSAGIAGYRSGKIYYRLTNIFAGKEYEFTAYVAKSSEFNLTISADTTVTSSVQVLGSNTWQKVTINFIPTDNNPEIVLDISNINYQDSVYMLDESVKIIKDNDMSNIWKDEIVDISHQALDTASKVEIEFSTLNPYSEKSIDSDGLREIGKNKELWKMEDFILPTFDVKSIDVANNEFTFSPEGMNGNNIQNVDGKNTVFAWLPYSGKFIIDNDSLQRVYEYEGLEALIKAPFEQGLEPAVIKYVVKNDEDFIDAKNLNLGLPLKWSGKGFLKKKYPEPKSGYDESIMSPIIPISNASNNLTIIGEPKPLQPGFNRISISTGQSMKAIYLDPSISHINTVGAVMQATNNSGSSFGLILNGNSNKTNGLFVGIKSVNDKFLPYAKTINTFGEKEFTPSLNELNLSPYYQYVSRTSNGTVTNFGNALSMSLLFKLEAQTILVGSNVELSLYLNNNRIAIFTIPEKEVVALNDDNLGVFAYNSSINVSAIYWASQRSNNISDRVLPTLRYSAPESPQVIEMIKRDNPGISPQRLQELVEQYLAVVDRSSAALSQVNEYKSLGIPHQYFAFYGTQNSYDVYLTTGANNQVGRIL